MKFQYKAFDRAGKANTDSVEANDAAEATEKLRRQGLYVTEIAASDEAFGGSDKVKGSFFGKVRRLRCLAMFSRQLFVLVSTGTPLVQTLGALERQITDVDFRRVVLDLREQVEEGASLSMAMRRHPQYFDNVCSSLIAAGESSGNFDAMVDRVATLTRKQMQVRSSVTGALVYPALLICVSITVLTLLMTFVLPRFEDLFKSLDTPLPPSTKILMAISVAVRQYWWLMIISLVGAIAASKMWIKTPPGKRFLDTALIKLPSIGRITKSFATARITRLLGVLVQSKVPLLEALTLTRGTTNNSHYSELLQAAEAAVTRGESISSAFTRPDLVSTSVVEAMRSGERSGQIGALLVNISDFLDEENEVIVKSLTSILEPVILVMLGFLVGLVALSLFMPLFDLTAATRGGG
ncbi:MAG TPA: type II secretion system F family protein [Tepidisphaeraceae bacterium]|jgi:type II secretory pathway component PulF